MRTFRTPSYMNQLPLHLALLDRPDRLVQIGPAPTQTHGGALDENPCGGSQKWGTGHPKMDGL